MHHQLVDVITNLAEARRVLLDGFDTDPRPWTTDVSGSVDAALEHVGKAIDAAVVAALGSGVPRAAVDAAGIEAISPEPLE